MALCKEYLYFFRLAKYYFQFDNFLFVFTLAITQCSSINVFRILHYHREWKTVVNHSLIEDRQ